MVTHANIWVFTSKACGDTLPRFCLKSLSSHYNTVCSSPLQIPSRFAKWPDIAKVPWSSHLHGMVFATKNTSWCGPDVPLDAWRSWVISSFDIDVLFYWSHFPFSKGHSPTPRMRDREREEELCAWTPWGEGLTCWSFKIFKSPMLSESRWISGKITGK